VGVPFAQGALRSDDVLSVEIDGNPVPCQARPLSTWPDGSVKWALVDYVCTIPRQGQAEAELIAGQTPAERPTPSHTLSVDETDSGIHVDNSVLSFDLRRDRFRLLEDLSLRGQPVLHGIDGSARRTGRQANATSSCLPLQQLEIEESGPVKAVIRLRGTLAESEDGSGKLLDFTARITVAAGAPWVRFEWCLVNPGYDLVEVPDARRAEEGEILAGSLHDRAHTPIGLMRLGFDVALPGCEAALLGGDVIHTFNYEVHPPASYLVPFEAGEPELWQSPDRGGCRAWACGHGPEGLDWIDLKDESVSYRVAPRPLHRRLEDGSETIRLLAPLAGWVHLTNGQMGFTVQVQHSYENRPKKIEIGTDALNLDLWPSEEGTLEYEEGVAKTHIVTLSLFDQDMRSAHVDTVAAARSRPVVPRLDPHYVQQTGAMGDIFPADPERYPALEMALRIGSRNTRRTGQGMMNWGDEGTETFMNNQYDWQFACFLYFLRSGLESTFIDGEACTWHSMDVDTIHHHRDPLMFEGQHDGRAGHTERPVDPHMLYCQGILTYYHLTGHPRALEIACGIARNAVRQMREGGAVFNNGRTAGWSMLCVAAVYEETRDEELRQALEEYFDRLEEWQDEDGGFRQRIADGHNGYWNGSNAFLSGILLSSLYRAWEATGSDRARRMFLKGVDHLVERMTLAHGVLGSTEGPSGENSFCVGTSYSMHGQTQALAWASKLTGDPKYIEQAVQFWEFGLKFDGGLQQLCDIRMAWWALFRFLHNAHEFGLLDRVESQWNSPRPSS